MTEDTANKPTVGVSIAGDVLKCFVERIECLEEERKVLAADIKEVFDEAKGIGVDPKIMRLVIRTRKMDEADLNEQNSLYENYCRALGMISW